VTTEVLPDRPSAPPAGWPRIAVVIPVRNDARRLERCLASLARQDYPPESWELAVVDNGSTDDSAVVAGRFGAKVLLCPGLRVGALRNRGVAATTGDLLGFVDSDHEVPGDWLRAAAREFQSHADTTALGYPYLPPPDGTWVQKTWALHRLRRGHARRDAPWLASGNLFVRRAAFERVGGFREELVAAEDVDLCRRLAAAGGRVVADPAVANVHHGEPATLAHFVRKEFWHGASGLRALFGQQFSWRELLTLVYPLYHLLAAVGVIAGLAYGLATGAWGWLPVALAVLVLPPVLLAARTAWAVRRPGTLPALAALYLAYGLVRAAALFRG
jgi:GT2 family glycosyltransferase